MPHWAKASRLRADAWQDKAPRMLRAGRKSALPSNRERAKST